MFVVLMMKWQLFLKKDFGGMTRKKLKMKEKLVSGSIPRCLALVPPLLATTL